MKTKVFVSVLFLLPLFILAQNLLDMPEGISYDYEGNRFFVSCWDGHNVIAITDEGVQSVFANYLSHCANNLIYNDVLYVTYGNHVKGFALVDGSEVFSIYLSGAQDADGLAVANDGFLYVLTHNAKIFKINIAEVSSELFVNGGIGSFPQDMIYDEPHDRLLVCSYQSNCSIYGVNLPDGDVSIVANTTLNNLDGLTVDGDGNYYIASWGTNSVYRFDSEFIDPPELVSSGHNGPSGIEINIEDNLLYVSNFYTDIIDMVSLPSSSTDQGSLMKPSIKLHKNFPNPFNPETTIYFSTTELIENTEISIYNLRGQKVKQFSELRNQTSVIWDGKDKNAKQVSSGIYFFRLKSGEQSHTRKMILMK